MKKEIIQKLINQIAQNKKDIQILKTKVTRLENKLKDGKQSYSYSYLEEMPEEEKYYFINIFKNLGMTKFEEKREECLDWLRSNGKRKTDYRAYLRNWIGRTYERMTKKEVERNKETLEKLKRFKQRNNLN